MVLDFALMSLLLIVAHVLRSWSAFLQRIYLPSAILAGFIGLVGSNQNLGLIPFQETSSGNLALAAYPTFLVALLFGTLFMGAREDSGGRLIRRAGDTFFYNVASEIGQYAAALLLGMFLLRTLFPDLDAGFALLLPAGFSGGHGTATAIGQVLQEAGWDDALTIGYTFSTVGLLAGVVGGILLINLATKRGWTRLVKTPHELPESVRKGFLLQSQRSPLGQETVSPIAIDPLAWHIALVLSAFGLAYLARDLAASVLPESFVLPLFAIAMLAGALIQKILDGLGLGIFVDPRVMERIGSTTSDYLVAFAITSIKITVVLDYLLPLAVMCLFGVVYSVVFFWFVGRKIFRNFWLERSLFVYGWNTGVVAVGIALLRIVDPKFRSKTLEDFGIAYLGLSLVSISLIVIVPQLIIRDYIAGTAGSLSIACCACLLLSKHLIGWFARPPDQLREGEAQVIGRDNRGTEQ
jgi:ESS family glutamate:Na+ symporter